MLCSALENLDSIASCLAGVVFIGLPHIDPADEQEWDSQVELLLSQMKKPSKKLKDHDEVKPVATVSARFEEVDVPCPVMTISERKDSKTRTLA